MINVPHIDAAERLLQELGVTAPDEIDLEAIAYYLGARVKFGVLNNCEARIIGVGDKAVITVNSRSSSVRQRFSIAHELGHWQFHRGRKLICRVNEMERDVRVAKSPERVADNYAANLLMPNYLFRPVVRRHSALSFSAVDDVSQVFGVSYTAAAIRIVESDQIPGFLICHGKYGRKWFAKSPKVPLRWFPKDELDSRSFAFSVLFGRRPNNPSPYRISADAWFGTGDASSFFVSEQTVRLTADELLTLIGITDPKMFEEVDSSQDRWRMGGNSR